MPPPSSSHPALVLAAIIAVFTLGVGCTTTRPSVFDEEQIDEAIEMLVRPLPGDLAAVYDLRAVGSPGLRVSVLTAGNDGRMTVSEPFGAAVSLTAWSADGPSVFYDMDEGCRRETADLREILGVGALPLAQAARLLGGRLPWISGDEIIRSDPSGVEIRGTGWYARVRLAAEPWRVVEVEDLRPSGGGAWRIELGEHNDALPGWIRVTNPDGRRVILDLRRIEWPEGVSLPDPPAFPRCGGS
jgi:hypothetical protein